MLHKIIFIADSAWFENRGMAEFFASSARLQGQTHSSLGGLRVFSTPLVFLCVK